MIRRTIRAWFASIAERVLRERPPSLGFVPPKVGDVFVSPRGRRYLVEAHLDEYHVRVRDSRTGEFDRAFWPLMVRDNGWRKE